MHVPITERTSITNICYGYTHNYKHTNNYGWLLARLPAKCVLSMDRRNNQGAGIILAVQGYERGGKDGILLFTCLLLD